MESGQELVAGIDKNKTCELVKTEGGEYLEINKEEEIKKSA